jgi:hypothetical protein
MGAERRVMGPEEVTKDVWKDGGNRISKGNKRPRGLLHRENGKGLQT